MSQGSVTGSNGIGFGAVAEIANLIGEAPILSTHFTVREVDDGTFAGRLEFFSAAVHDAEDSHAVARQAALSPQVA